jgi:arsenate reductase-like glutaredoxin family protein
VNEDMLIARPVALASGGLLVSRPRNALNARPVELNGAGCS